MRITAATIWTLLILGACTIPGSNIPDVGLWNIDKAAHFFLFAVGTWLWLWALPVNRKNYLLVFLGGVVYAVATEIYQGYLPWPRTPDLLDVVANVLGTLGGLMLFKVWKKKISFFRFFLDREGNLRP